MQGTVQIPVFHVNTGISLLQLGNTSLNAFQNCILYLSHFVTHGYFEFNHLGLPTTFQRLRDGDVKSGPQGWFAQKEIPHLVREGCKSGRERFRAV